jgi:hypothetical protein
MKNVGSESRENCPRAQKQYFKPSCAILTADQVRMKLASAPLGDKQAEEWMAMIGITQKKGPDSVANKKDPDNVAEQLRLALKHLSNAQKDVDLAGILDALELAYAKDCIAAALRDYEEESGRESAA